MLDRLTELEHEKAGIEAEVERALRGLIGKIVIHPGAARGAYTAELHGQVAALAALAGGQDAANPAIMLSMVAEEGLEPPTRGL